MNAARAAHLMQRGMQVSEIAWVGPANTWTRGGKEEGEIQPDHTHRVKRSLYV